MLDTSDIQILKQMFGEMLHGELDDFKVEVRDEIRSCISGSEARMMREMGKIRDEMREMKEDIVETISEGILPQIDDHETRLVRLEQKTA